MVEELKNPMIKNTQTGQIVELIQSPFTIGRGLGCDYVTENKVTSRRHCTLIEESEGQWTLTDLSTNGTLINNEILIKNGQTSSPLQHKDTFNTGEVWEFLSKSKPPDQLERVQRQEESPAPSPNSFDEHGISDEILLRLADQVEGQLESQEKPKGNKNTTEETNCPSTSGTNVTSCNNNQPNKNPISPDPIPRVTEEIHSKLCEIKPEKHDKTLTLDVCPMETVSKQSENEKNKNAILNNVSMVTEHTSHIPKLSENQAQQLNNSILNTGPHNPTVPQELQTITRIVVPTTINIPSSSSISTEAYISPDNCNKKLKIVTNPSTIVTTKISPSVKVVKKTTPSSSTVTKTEQVTPQKISPKGQLRVLTAEQVKTLKETGKLMQGNKCLVLRPSNISVNISSSENSNVNCQISVKSSGSSQLTTSNSSNAGPKLNVSVSSGSNQTNYTNTFVNPNVTGLSNVPLLDIANIPIVISNTPILLPPLSNISTVSSTSSTIPIIDITKNRTIPPEPIVISNVPQPIDLTDIAVPETSVPAPANEVVVETSEVAESVVSSTKVHDSQEPGPSKDASKDNKEQHQFEEMEDELLCTICANLFIKTVTLGCSHSFCQYCIDTWKKKKSDCPICRNKITSTIRTLVLDNVIEKMIETASDEIKQARKQALEERKQSEEQIEKQKKEAEEQRNSGRGGRRGRGGNHNRGRGNTGGQPIQRNNSGNQGDQTNQRNNATNNRPVVQAPAPTEFITIADSPSTTSDESDEDGWSDEYNSDEWYNGRPGAYYGGYGSCFICGDRGHWANGCPYRS